VALQLERCALLRHPLLHGVHRTAFVTVLSSGPPVEAGPEPIAAAVLLSFGPDWTSAFAVRLTLVTCCWSLVARMTTAGP
jgi:hypothetical protein